MEAYFKALQTLAVLEYNLKIEQINKKKLVEEVKSHQNTYTTLVEQDAKRLTLEDYHLKSNNMTEAEQMAYVENIKEEDRRIMKSLKYTINMAMAEVQKSALNVAIQNQKIKQLINNHPKLEDVDWASL